MKTREYFNLQRDMKRRIFLIKKEEFCKQKVLDVVEKVFDEYKKDFLEREDETAVDRKEILKSNIAMLVFDSTPDTVALGYRTLSDFLNYDALLDKNKIQETIGKPVSAKNWNIIESALLEIERGHYAPALRTVTRVLNESNFEPDYNEIAAIKRVICAFVQKTGINLSKIDPDYSVLDKEILGLEKEDFEREE